MALVNLGDYFCRLELCGEGSIECSLFEFDKNSLKFRYYKSSGPIDFFSMKLNSKFLLICLKDSDKESKKYILGGSSILNESGLYVQI